MQESVSRHSVPRFSLLPKTSAQWLPLALLATVSVISGPSSVQAQSLERLEVKMHIGPTATFAPVMYAYQTGCFRKGGIDAHIEDGTGSVATTNIVGNGHFDVGISDLSVRLSDALVDLDQHVTVTLGAETLFTGPVSRTIGTVAKTLGERGDPALVFPAEVAVTIP